MSAKVLQIQELLDLIIDTVSSGAYTTAPLKWLSLVSKAWRTRSQRNRFKEFRLNLFKMEQIHSEIFKSTDPAASQQRCRDLFSYVQTLEVKAGGPNSSKNFSQYLEILRLFTEVASLRIDSWGVPEFESFHDKGFLQHFCKTVKMLSLNCCSFYSEVLIFLTSSFICIDDLQVKIPHHCDNRTYKPQRDSQSLGVKFRGNLDFAFLKTQHNKFLAFVNEHSSDLRSIHVSECGDSGGELQNLFKCQGGTFLSVDIRVCDEKGKLVPISQYTCQQ